MWVKDLRSQPLHDMAASDWAELHEPCLYVGHIVAYECSLAEQCWGRVRVKVDDPARLCVWMMYVFYSGIA